MAITAYTGLPRNGKSYGVVENVILPAIKDGRTVHTNIPMKGEKWIELYGAMPVIFDVEDVTTNPNFWTEIVEPGSVVVIDEVWRLWPAGLSVNKIRESDKSFFAEHGHMVGENGLSIEIVLVTQDLAQIASFARMLVETTFRVTKLTKVGSEKRFRVDVYSGSVTGQNPPASKRENEFHGKFQKKITDLYISHTKSEVGAGKDTRVDKRFSIFAGSKIYIFFTFIAVSLLIVIYGFSIVKKSYQIPDQELAEVEKSEEIIRAVQTGVINQETVDQYTVEQATNQDFLSSVSEIYISRSLGVFPDQKYSFQITDKESYFSINDVELIKMGYQLSPISSCLVLIQFEDKLHYVGCHHEGSGNFISNAISDR